MKMTVTLKKDEILRIVSEYVEKETGKKVKKIDLAVGTEYDRPGGGSYPVFKHIELEIE